MDTPALSPAEVTRVLDGMTPRQKRALKKTGFHWDGLHRLTQTPYGAGLVEAVSACHTGLLGRPPRAGEDEKAQAAQRHPGVDSAKSSGTSLSVSAGERGRLDVSPELLALEKEQKQADKSRRKAAEKAIEKHRRRDAERG